MATQTRRQHALGKEPLLVEYLVSWLQQCVVRHEAQTHIDGEDNDASKGAYWRRRKMVNEPIDQRKLKDRKKRKQKQQHELRLALAPWPVSYTHLTLPTKA